MVMSPLISIWIKETEYRDPQGTRASWCDSLFYQCSNTTSQFLLWFWNTSNLFLKYSTTKHNIAENLRYLAHLKFIFCKFIDSWWEWVIYVHDRLCFTAWYSLKKISKSNIITTLCTLASTLHFTHCHNDIKKDWSRWWPAILILYYTLVLLTECFWIDSLIMWIYI